MKYKFWSAFFTLIGFVASVALPIWATVSQVIVIKSNCDMSIWDTIGITLSGAVIVAVLVFFTLWKYFSAKIKEKMKPQRTLFGFFAVGYVIILVIKTLLTTIEAIFLAGAIGTAIAVICYYISDIIKERGVAHGG